MGQDYFVSNDYLKSGLNSLSEWETRSTSREADGCTPAFVEVDASCVISNVMVFALRSFTWISFRSL
jgi:hypothetical protein